MPRQKEAPRVLEDGRVVVKMGDTDYELVASRVARFRSQYAITDGWGLTTEVKVIQRDNDKDLVRALAKVTDPDGRVVATGNAEETRGKGFVNATAAVENCETSAIGRALGFAGFGSRDAVATADEIDAAETRAVAIQEQQAEQQRRESAAQQAAVFATELNRNTKRADRSGPGQHPDEELNARIKVALMRLKKIGVGDADLRNIVFQFVGGDQTRNLSDLDRDDVDRLDAGVADYAAMLEAS